MDIPIQLPPNYQHVLSWSWTNIKVSFDFWLLIVLTFPRWSRTSLSNGFTSMYLLLLFAVSHWIWKYSSACIRLAKSWFVYLWSVVTRWTPQYSFMFGVIWLIPYLCLLSFDVGCCWSCLTKLARLPYYLRVYKSLCHVRSDSTCSRAQL